MPEPFRLLHCLLYLLLLPAFFPAAAQSPYFIHHTTAQGLPSNTVHSVHRDSRGFLWMATDKGIARYNGTKYETFTTADGLPDNEIFFFQEDRDHRLWLGSFNGALCYYHEGVFHTAANTSFLKLPFKSNVRTITVETDGSLIVLYVNPAKFVWIRGNALRVYHPDSLLKDLDQTALLYVRRLYRGFEVRYADRSFCIDTNGRITGELPVQGHNLTYRTYHDQAYLYSDKKLINLDYRPLLDIARMKHAQLIIRNVYYDGSNYLISTNCGLYINGTHRLLPDIDISAAIRDWEGNYWLSTMRNGLYCLPRNFAGTIRFEQAYFGKAINVYASKDQIRLATFEGLLYILKKGKQAARIETLRQTISDLRKGSRVRWHTNENGVTAVVKGNTILLVSRNGHSFRQYSIPLPPSLKSFIQGSTKNIILDNDTLYLRYYAGIVKVLLPHGPRKRVRVWSTDRHPDRRFFEMKQGPGKIIWYATTDSVYQLQNDRSVTQRQFSPLSFNWFEFLGPYLIGCSRDNRLYLCDTRARQPVIGVIARQNCIWEGAVVLDTAHVLLLTNREYRLLTFQADSAKPHFSLRILESPFVPTGAEAVCVDSGYCYFLKDGNIARLKMSDLLAKPQPPALFLKEVKTKERVYLAGAERNVRLRLSYRESMNMTISFDVLSFGTTEPSCEYLISQEGMGSWRAVNGKAIELFNPGYGRFVVRARARNASGDYGEEALMILEIARPFWATAWFLIMVALSATTLLFLAVRYWLRMQLKRKEKEHSAAVRYLKSEYKALHALMNPHFIFNSLNNLQSLINRNDSDAANEFFQHFSALIRRNIQNATQELISLRQELELVSVYLRLEKLRFGTLLNYNIEVDEEVDTDLVQVPPLLIQPLVENAILHGLLPRQSSEGLVSVRVTENEEHVCIEVQDNGVGIKDEHSQRDFQHQSMGLDTIRKRIAHLNQIHNNRFSFFIAPIQDDAGCPTGTRAIIDIYYPEG